MSIDNLSDFLENKHFESEKIEKMIREYWEINKIYQLDTADLDPDKLKLIDTPPPYANGALHHGHGMSYTQLDILARYHRMREPTILPLAFDDNGLPTERFTEEKYGILPGHHPENFFQLCKEEAEKGIQLQREQFDYLGFSYDHQTAYRTIDNRTMRITQLDFIDLLSQDKIMRQSEPQLYCTRCQTALAQADLENKEIDGKMYYIRFSTNSDPIIIGTTRPELIPAAVAIFYHPEDNRNNYSNMRIFNPISGEELEILSDDRIDQDKGTGIMMCATFGDQLDIELYREYNLPNRSIIDESGKITYSNYKGLSIQEARIKTIQDLQSKGLLDEIHDVNHQIPICERCSTPMEITESEQWSLDILSIKKELIDFIEKINIEPNYMRKRLINWIKGLKWNWTISRQRYYGIPIPMYFCNNCDKHFPAQRNEIPILPSDPKTRPCKFCGRIANRDTDIFDTWMASSLTPQILADVYFDTKLMTPLFMRTQAHEIIRTWAFYTIIKQYLSKSQIIPWNNLLISGWGLGFKSKGKRGIKASKSSGSGKNPIELIKQYGADAFRYWAASARLGKDQYLMEATLNRGRKLTTKLFNAAKITFILLHQTKDTEIDDTNICKISNERINSLRQEYENSMKQFSYTDAFQALEENFWNGYCAIDIENFKKKAYDIGLSDTEKKTVRKLWDSYLHLFAPFMPFITEYLWYLTWQFNIQAEHTRDSNFDPSKYRSIHNKSISNLPVEQQLW